MYCALQHWRFEVVCVHFDQNNERCKGLFIVTIRLDVTNALTFYQMTIHFELI